MHKRYAFIGAGEGTWRVQWSRAVRGEALAPATHVSVMPVDGPPGGEPVSWRLEGHMSNLRYATRSELTVLRSTQEPLGRPDARCAAMIPIRKSAAWWELAQDERRAIFEETSHHTAIGLAYLPAISRQLYHARDLGQPFDFITWFEYARPHAGEFEELVARLRSSREWDFVDREVDIRLELAA